MDSFMMINSSYLTAIWKYLMMHTGLTICDYKVAIPEYGESKML
jgi:hypothetical protein